MTEVADRYWSKMTEFKAHCHYIHEYLISTESWDRKINGFLAITSCSSIAGWAIWQDFSFVWALIIASSQVVTAVKPFLPFSKRIKPLRGLSYAFDDLFVDLENDWFDISKGNLTEREIHDKIIDFARNQNKLWKKHIGELTLPHKEKLHDESISIAEEYFAQNY